ncbi:MAG TPA: hypothetical protein ENG70_05665 [Candidatus Cloacimonetes bacterium]|nr:hypothetical protein [Candidatus Cloacimonadota bacterium]HEX38320.1 hypothetical protein [Candidatus Cloacimonadota bacterium]
MNSPLRLIISLVGFALLWFGYLGIRNGEVRIKGGFKISKEEKPTLYWINVAIYIIVGIAGLLFGLVS